MANFPLRGSCDECHARKVRCVGAAMGCRSCRFNGRHCKVSPRARMGRPWTRNQNTSQAVSATNARGELSPADSSSLNTFATPDGTHFARGLCEEGASPLPEGPVPHALRELIVEMEYSVPGQATGPLNDHSTPAPSSSNRSPHQSMELSSYRRSNHPEFSILPGTGYHSHMRTSHDVEHIPKSSPQKEEDPLLEVFSELSNLQFDLHRQRDQLAKTEIEIQAYSQMTGLASMLQTCSAICTVAHSMLRREKGIGLDASSTRTSTSIFDSAANEATLLLLLTIVLEGLKLLETLVRISKSSPLDRQQDSVGVEMGAKAGDQWLDGEALNSDPSSYFIDEHSGREKSSISKALVASSLTSRVNLQRVLVLTVIDLQLSSLGAVLDRLEERSLVPKVASSLSEGRKKTSQIRLDVEEILRVSTKPWDH